MMRLSSGWTSAKVHVGVTASLNCFSCDCALLLARIVGPPWLLAPMRIEPSFVTSATTVSLGAGGNSFGRPLCK